MGHHVLKGTSSVPRFPPATGEMCGRISIQICVAICGRQKDRRNQLQISPILTSKWPLSLSIKKCIYIIHNTMALPFSTTQFLVRIHARSSVGYSTIHPTTSQFLWILRPSCNFFEIISRCGPPTCKIPAVPWVGDGDILDRWPGVGRIRRNGTQPVVRGGS